MIPRRHRVLIVTGEASGDLHGAALVRAMRDRQPELHFIGMGGQEMAAAGVVILFDASRVAVVGLVEVLSHLSDIRAAQKILAGALSEQRPDLLIIIDLPDFNLLLAKKAKSLGIPVFYYITPQVWAWRQGRVKTIARRVDRLGVILPFEEQFFRERGLRADYVGHPLLDSVPQSVDGMAFRQQQRIDPQALCIGLLPGSRLREVDMLLPPFLEAAALLAARCSKKLVFLIPRASTISVEALQERGLARYQQSLDIRVLSEDRYQLMAACQAVVAASGTVTLELALLNVPMVVCYKFTPLTYLLGKLLVRVQRFSLVNLIAGADVVPELLQQQVTPERIAGELEKIVVAGPARDAMFAGLFAVRQRLGEKGASQKAATLALAMLAGEKRSE